MRRVKLGGWKASSCGRAIVYRALNRGNDYRWKQDELEYLMWWCRFWGRPTPPKGAYVGRWREW